MEITEGALGFERRESTGAAGRAARGPAPSTAGRPVRLPASGWRFRSLNPLGRLSSSMASLNVLWELGRLYFAQTGLILPGSRTQGQPCARVDVPPGAELLDLTT